MTACRSPFWSYPPCACPKCRAARASRAEPARMPPENCAPFSEARTAAAPGSVPLGSEMACAVCGKAIMKTRLARRFCSKFCNDTFHGRRRRVVA